jgi:signal transduction histidine kinase/ligand-binding sensor domain-containing protein
MLEFFPALERLAKRLLVTLAACMPLAMSTSAWALTLADYEHTSWGAKDGAGGSVIWASEVPAGMLLLKTPIGYQVFDGVEFHTFERDKPPPFADFARALGQSNGKGAIYFIHPVTQHLMREWRGRTEAVEDKDESTRWSTRFVFDRDGTGWLSALNHLYRLDGLKVELVGPTWDLPKVKLGNVVAGAGGTVWVGTEDEGGGALYHLARGARKFERFAQPVDCSQMASGPDGSLWCTSSEGVAVVTVDHDRPVSRRLVSKRPAAGVAFDRRGGIWIGTRSGIAHLSNWRDLLKPGGDAALETDTMTPREGLSSDAIWWLGEDSTGDMWVATGAGLDRFRTIPFAPVKLPRRDFGAAISPEVDGGMWVGNWDRSMMHLAGGRIEDVPNVEHVTAIRKDAQGRTWVAGAEGIWRKDPPGPFMRVDGPPMSQMPLLRQIAQDDSGAMWFQAGNQLFRLQDGVWSKPQGPGAPPSDTFYFMLSDEQRQLWFAGARRGVYVLKGGVVREITSPAYVAAIGEALSAYSRGPRVWVGGRTGVGVFVGDTFHPLKLVDDVARDITGIVETAAGELWLHGLTKAFRIRMDQVATGLAGQIVTAQVFDFHDGLRAPTSKFEPRPTLIQDSAGRLWFSTTQGLFWMDPDAAATRNADPEPPQTLLRNVRSDGKLIAAGDEMLLPPNPGQTEFSYAAAALGVSDRIHYRYRLGGIDEDWQEAGIRRKAYYTHLPPGRYRFEVVASNEQGRWSQLPTALTFEVQAAWYQTALFRTFVAALAVSLLWLAYFARMRLVASRERARMRAIAAERERIARDLHDTLLQSMQGLIFGFQGLANRLPAHDEVRRSMEERLDQADELLGEARDRVHDLRSAESTTISLREAFDLAAAELAGTVRVTIVEEGKSCPLRPIARDEAYLVGREALLNAVTHGNGTWIELRLHFSARRLTLHVRDNGKGIDPAVLADGARPGHFGLPGMRERAAQLGGELMVRRARGGGTEVILDIPASSAFEHDSTNDPWFKLRSTIARWCRRACEFVGRGCRRCDGPRGPDR